MVGSFSGLVNRVCNVSVSWVSWSGLLSFRELVRSTYESEIGAERVGGGGEEGKKVVGVWNKIVGSHPCPDIVRGEGQSRDGCWLVWTVRWDTGEGAGEGGTAIYSYWNEWLYRSMQNEKSSTQRTLKFKGEKCFYFSSGLYDLRSRRNRKIIMEERKKNEKSRLGKWRNCLNGIFENPCIFKWWCCCQWKWSMLELPLFLAPAALYSGSCFTRARHTRGDFSLALCFAFPFHNFRLSQSLPVYQTFSRCIISISACSLSSLSLCSVP